jgi:nucleotide-binding universal stress UspA family protein
LDLSVLTVINIPHLNSTRPDSQWRPACVKRETEAANETFQHICEMFAGADASVQHLSREGYLGETIVDEATKSGADLVVLGARGRSTISRILLGSTSDYVATHAPCSVLVVRPTGIQAHQHQQLRVALAYDDTGPSQAAIEEFSEFEWGQHTEMHVVSVVSYVSEFLNEVVIEPDDVKQEAEKGLRVAAKQLRDVAPSVHSHLIECDHIGDGIVQFTEEQDCDLVVMGNTSRSKLGQLLLGSVSRYVLRHAPCSVWITRNRMIKGTASRANQSAEVV